MIRAIARQAEAERERRAKMIHAEGEYMAAEKLGMAAEVIQKQPARFSCATCKRLVEIGSEKNTTIVFPLRSIYLLPWGARSREPGWPGRPVAVEYPLMPRNDEGEFELVLGKSPVT